MKSYSSNSVSPVLRNLLFFLAMVGLVLVAVWYIAAPGPIFYFSAGWLVMILLLLWLGNRLLTRWLDKRMSWSSYGNWRFFTQLILALLYLLFLINTIYFVIKVLLTQDPPTAEQFIVMNSWGAVIFIPIFSLYFSLHFLRHWRNTEVIAARVQKENLRSQLDSLKNHLDPHFLFNNLNILASLIDRDPAASSVFVQKFADVYRTMLRTKSDDLIPVQEEMQFIQSYMYLLKVRFEHHIQFTSSVSPVASQRLIPPLTLQMLVENAIKHNRIQESQTLRIDVMEGNDQYLIVQNTLHGNTESSGMGSGLKNIEQRYAHFTDKPVKVIRTDLHFEVHIPLLTVEVA